MKATSCLQCREAKRRCVKQTIDSPCKNCQRKNLACSSHVSSQTTSAPKENQEFVPDLTDELAIEFVESYLTHLDGRAHSIFHQETLRRQVRRKEIGDALLYAICALGSKFSPKSEHRALEAPLVKGAKRLVQADLENVCIEHVQTCILLSLLSAGNCHTSSETLFLREFICCGYKSISCEFTDALQELRLVWLKFFSLTFRWMSQVLPVRQPLEFGGHFTYSIVGVLLVLEYPGTWTTLAALTRLLCLSTKPPSDALVLRAYSKILVELRVSLRIW